MAGMIYFNKFDTAKGRMIAMCDEELMGNIFEEGKIIIDLEHYGGFYKGELLTEDDARKQLGPAVYSANVIGNRSVKLLIEAKLVKESDVKTVQGVKFVHLFKVDM